MSDSATEAGSLPRTGLTPRQRRNFGVGVQYAILVLIVVVAAVALDWQRFQEVFFNPSTFKFLFPDLITIGLVNTMIYTCSGYVIGFFLGLLIAVMRLSAVRLNRWFAHGYIELFRGLPALLVFMLLGYGLPVVLGPDRQLPFPPYGTVAIALGLVSAAYMAETFRAGIQAVPKGQVEAARSLGMSATRAMVTVVLPQAIRIVIPPLTNELIMLFKDSSLVFAVGLTAGTAELAKIGNDLATEHANSTPIVLAGLSYLVITLPLGFLVRRLEARQAKAR
ncbi:amino acid ABC transporter permease [Actinorhabdospora filicis]|uniref:Amino acid ABC transporter permease n=1 Tax=Actinorhabdospora filicis TaxID=1785913 RepID=A0A9W6SMN7_9ACTN|nr:amino acid ABC transporter permease [Actinorhabdospora filicis]GLZ78717.1 amino acid ABC transporter permease [Actinorhabdospora filicis]